MKMLNVALAAAALAFAATTVGSVTPADAQVSIRAGEHGVGVRIGDTHRHRFHNHGYYARTDRQIAVPSRHASFAPTGRS